MGAHLQRAHLLDQLLIPFDEPDQRWAPPCEPAGRVRAPQSRSQGTGTRQIGTR